MLQGIICKCLMRVQNDSIDFVGIKLNFYQNQWTKASCISFQGIYLKFKTELIEPGHWTFTANISKLKNVALYWLFVILNHDIWKKVIWYKWASAWFLIHFVLIYHLLFVKILFLCKDTDDLFKVIQFHLQSFEVRNIWYLPKYGKAVCSKLLNVNGTVRRINFLINLFCQGHRFIFIDKTNITQLPIYGKMTYV